MLEKLKRYTTLPIRKQRTESLIFSRLDYCNNLFIELLDLLKVYEKL